MRGFAVVLVLVCAGLLAACGDDASPGVQPSAQQSAQQSAQPSTGIRTLTPIEVPPHGPPPGELVADMRQASRDSALNRMQVWIGNGLERDLTPTSIRYLDPRYREPVRGERLRTIPGGVEIGFPLPLPSRPACGTRAGSGSGRVDVEYADQRATVPVEDEADVVERHVASRCLQLDVDEVATLAWVRDFRIRGEGQGSIADFVLVATPSGRGDGVLTIDSVAGTPVITADDRDAWRPDVTVRADGPVQRIVLPARPARCDGHAFLESGGATAFLVRLRLDVGGRERTGELIVRMEPPVAARAIGFAADSCGLG